MAADTLTSTQVRAYRILSSGLDRTTTTAPDLPIWDLGLQDRDGSTRVALAARLADPAMIPDVDDPAGSGWATLAWSLRGSPHLHRRGDLRRIASALWPADDTDAAARLLGDAGRLTAAGAQPLESYVAVADAMREVITAPMVKGAASAAVTAALPARYSGFCRGCGSVHVRELLFRSAALPAGIGLVAGTKPVVLEPLSRSFRRPDRQDGLDRLIAEYYHRYGVGTPSDVGTHVGTSATGIKGSLPEDLVPIAVDGARSRARAATLDEIREVDLDRAAGIVRLIPPSDPLLQPRDRSILTADRSRQKQLWPALGAPGAVLAGGALAGVWRTRATAAGLTVTITGWRTFDRHELAALDDEAQIVGIARRAARTTLVIS